MWCPCCRGEFDAFLPFGLVPRPNALCPGCQSLERHRLIWLYLERENLLPRPGLSVLHVAPEDALAQPYASSPGVSYLGIDREPGHASVVMDVTQLGCGAGVFDLVICNHVLEHIPDDIKAMQELRRVLKPGGCAILQVPMTWELAVTQEDLSITDPAVRERLYGQRDHVRLYGRDYVDRLARAGFVVHIDRMAEELDEGERARMGLQNEVIISCTTADAADPFRHPGQPNGQLA